MKKIKIKNIVVRRLRPDADLLEELNTLAQKENISLGLISGIGALKSAALGIFLAEENRYETREFAGELEICHLSGNISLKDKKPFVHAHIMISDRHGRAWGGHLLPGCPIFVAEVVILALEGSKKERLPQPELSGLSLWPLEDDG
ncbi:MAG: DNA-binding protein [Clostridiales bacterium]|nr:DNA-binding protein [Clostridiales bacterium]